MIADVQCTPDPKAKDYYQLKITEDSGDITEVSLERSEARHIIQVVDNSIGI